MSYFYRIFATKNDVWVITKALYFIHYLFNIIKQS